MADKMAAIGAEQIIVTAKLAAGTAFHEVDIQRTVATMQANLTTGRKLIRTLFDNTIMQAGIADDRTAGGHYAIMRQDNSKPDRNNITRFEERQEVDTRHLFGCDLFMVGRIFVVEDKQITRLAFQFPAQGFQCREPDRFRLASLQDREIGQRYANAL
jgi:hypothetical protein